MKYDIDDLNNKIHTRQLEGVGERLEEDVYGILNRAGIYFRVFNRAKTPFSIIHKLGKDGYGFGEDEKKLQDIIGLRVVAYYHDDLDIMRTILDKTFRRVGEWSETENTHEEFKPAKMNGVFRVPEEYLQVYNGDLSEYPIDPTFEVQLRTVSFEGWHEIEHDMRYKSPHGEEFWRNNEDLSRTLNCVLANLELCDWSTLSVFDKLAEYHYKAANWEMMLKGKFRLRFDAQPLSQELIEFLDNNQEVASCLYRCDRAEVIFVLMREGMYGKITYDLVVKAANEAVATYDVKTQRRVSKICHKVIERKRMARTEHQDLLRLDVTPSFRLNVRLAHNSNREVKQEFLDAVRVIGQWAQGRFHDIVDDIPLVPVDYEFHIPGYDLMIMGNVSLGFYKMTMDHLDVTRKGVVWKTSVSLECSDKICMKVDCSYYHTTDRLVRESFSKPRFVDEIFRKIGYEDVIPMSLKPRRLSNMKDLEWISGFINDHNRTLPVILAVEEEDKERQINIARLAETVGTYAHVFMLEKKAISIMVDTSDYTLDELTGAVWVSFCNGEDKFFTREMIADSRFDLNKYAFDQGNVYEKAFRHRLVRLLKEKNCQ